MKTNTHRSLLHFPFSGSEISESENFLGKRVLFAVTPENNDSTYAETIAEKEHSNDQKKFEERGVQKETREYLGTPKIPQYPTHTKVGMQMEVPAAKKRLEQSLLSTLQNKEVSTADKYNTTEKNWTEKPCELFEFGETPIFLTHEDFVSIKGDSLDENGTSLSDWQKRNFMSNPSKGLSVAFRHLDESVFAAKIEKGVDGRFYLSEEGVADLAQTFERIEDTNAYREEAISGYAIDAVRSTKMTPEQRQDFEHSTLADLAGNADGVISLFQKFPNTFLGFNIGSEIRNIKGHVSQKEMGKSVETLMYSILQVAEKKATGAGLTPEEFTAAKNFLIDEGRGDMQKDWDDKNGISQFFSKNPLDGPKALTDALAFSTGIEKWVVALTDVAKGEDYAMTLVKLGKSVAHTFPRNGKNINGGMNGKPSLQQNTQYTSKIKQVIKPSTYQESTRLGLNAAKMQAVSNDIETILQNTSFDEDFVRSYSHTDIGMGVIVDGAFPKGFTDEKGNVLDGMPKDTTTESTRTVYDTTDVEYGAFKTVKADTKTRNVLVSMSPQVQSELQSVITGKPLVNSSTAVTTGPEYSQTTNNGKSEVTTTYQDVTAETTTDTTTNTTTTTVTNTKTGEKYKIIDTTVGKERVITTTRRVGKEKTTVVTTYTKKKTPVRIKVNLTASAHTSRLDHTDAGTFVTTLSGFGQVNINNPKEAIAGLHLEEKYDILDSGLYVKGGVGVSKDLHTGNILNHSSIGGGYENDDFGIGITKNAIRMNEYGAQEISGLRVSGVIKGKKYDLFAGANMSEEGKILSGNIGITKNKDYYTNALKEVYKGIDDIQALKAINAKRKRLGIAPINSSSQAVIAKEKAFLAAHLLGDKINGSLKTMGISGSENGISLMLGFVMDTKIMEQVTGLDSRMFAVMEQNLSQLGINQDKRLYQDLTLDQLGKNQNGTYDLYPQARGKEYKGNSIASQGVDIPVVIYGENNVQVYNDGTFGFLDGVHPHAPIIIERTTMAGTQLEVHFGGNIADAKYGSNSVINGSLGADGRIQRLTTHTYTPAEKEDQVMSMPDSVVDYYEMKAMKKVYLAPPGKEREYTADVTEMKSNIVQKIGKISNNAKKKAAFNDIYDLEKNMEKSGFNPENNNEIETAVAKTFSQLGLDNSIKDKFANKPYFVYQALVRARMQLMNRNSNGKLVYTPQQKLERAKRPKGNFADYMKETFGGREFSPKMNDINTTRLLPKGALGIVQGMKGNATYFQNASGMKMRGVQQKRGEINNISGTFYDGFLEECNNASRFFVPDAKPAPARKGGIMSASQAIHSGYQAQIDELSLSLGATVQPFVVTKHVSTKIDNWEEVDVKHKTEYKEDTNRKKVKVGDVIKQKVKHNTTSKTTRNTDTETHTNVIREDIGDPVDVPPLPPVDPTPIITPPPIKDPDDAPPLPIVNPTPLVNTN